MNQNERIMEYMGLMQEVMQKTGITYAVETGKNLILFDTLTNEPIELEITVGTEIIKKNGQTSITTFDRSDVNG